MNSLEMMYVSFDNNGDIKSISPTIPPSNSDYTISTFPLFEVEGFLVGHKNPFDFYVKVEKKSVGANYKITRKQALVANFLRTLDNFLIEIKRMPRSNDASLLIENYSVSKEIKISLNETIKLLRYEGTDDEQDSIATFLNSPSIVLFFTKKGDPYFLIQTILVSPKELFDNSEICIHYTANLANTSVYTKKLIDGYSYIIREK